MTGKCTVVGDGVIFYDTHRFDQLMLRRSRAQLTRGCPRTGASFWGYSAQPDLRCWHEVWINPLRYLQPGWCRGGA